MKKTNRTYRWVNSFIIIMILGAKIDLAGQGRLRAPTDLPCSRDHTTAFAGKVISIFRTPVRTVVRMHTDEATSERFVIVHEKNKGPEEWFRLNGEAFHSNDWTKIEAARDKIRPGMRATVWVCEEKKEEKGGAKPAQNPRVDWQPPSP